MSTAQETRNCITLKGSTQIVSEFFGYSINAILYQRGIYPPELFTPVKKYGLQMLLTVDEGLTKYLSPVLGHLSDWLVAKTVQKLVVVISGVDSSEPLERWVFNIETDPEITTEKGNSLEKSEKQISSEIQAIVRQITSSVTFLPLLEEPCTFDLLVYTSQEVSVPLSWEESDPKYITNSAEVRLRSFTTRVHKVDTVVAYKMAE